MRSPVHALLACPRCRTPGPVDSGGVLACASCAWRVPWDGRVVSVLDREAETSFDQKHTVVDDHNHHPVVWDLCYSGQVTRVEAALPAASVVVDLGCGPLPPYRPPAGATLVGVDPSLGSLQANPSLDLALHASATAVPLADGVADVLVALYSLHHMVGASVAESRSNVRAAFAELARLAAPGATVIVAEICPWAPAWALERVGWRAGRALLGDRVDFVFWPSKVLEAMGAQAFPDAALEIERHRVGPLAVLPPVIGAPRLKVPRLAYPFSVRSFRWKLGGSR